ncbi:hypothetical protein KFK09_006402 [Dendrobium nobile]|uniref:Uncharacterized protein n=1 Tax=Dendrobium nobile TaxID=94219 RepID=A0A8T3BTQ0_DENNO|nr:hypothetical protein KFK09_006402 [Dendrobium nobile]
MERSSGIQGRKADIPAVRVHRNQEESFAEVRSVLQAGAVHHSVEKSFAGVRPGSK